jgi:GNAT superfamily N-acetyltransferase
MSALSKLPEKDVERLSDLHRRVLPGSVLAKLGLRVLRYYYRWVEGSSRERLFLVRDHAGIQAAAVLSFDPETVLKRFLLQNPTALFPGLLVSAMTSRAARAQLIGCARDLIRGGGSPIGSPEILQIFTATDHRSDGLGTELIGRIEAELLQGDTTEYYAKTLLHGNDGAIEFYRRRGFQSIAQHTFLGERYLCLKKVVEVPPAAK